MSLSWKRLWC